LCSSPSIIRMIKSSRMRLAGNAERTSAKRNPYKILVCHPEGKRPLGRPRLMWEDNIKIGWGGMYWIYLVQDRD
jgi:hypothetical protein